MSEQEEREMLKRGIRDLEKRIENIDIILKKKNGKAGACPCRMSIGCAVLRTTRNKRGETQFRRKFLCLLSFSKKVSYSRMAPRSAEDTILA